MLKDALEDRSRRAKQIAKFLIVHRRIKALSVGFFLEAGFKLSIHPVIIKFRLLQRHL
jgi:hypothetical protein